MYDWRVAYVSLFTSQWALDYHHRRRRPMWRPVTLNCTHFWSSIHSFWVRKFQKSYFLDSILPKGVQFFCLILKCVKSKNYFWDYLTFNFLSHFHYVHMSCINFKWTYKNKNVTSKNISTALCRVCIPPSCVTCTHEVMWLRLIRWSREETILLLLLQRIECTADIF